MAREPMAELGAEDYRIVRHTHDVDLARRLMSAELRREYGCPRWDYEDWCQTADEVQRCEHLYYLPVARQVHVRIVPCLPGSYGEDAGWKFEYRECKPGRGAFPAVVFS